MVKRNLLSVVFLVGLILTAIACNAGVRVIKGSGNVITEDRQVSNFDSIELRGKCRDQRFRWDRSCRRCDHPRGQD